MWDDDRFVSLLLLWQIDEPQQLVLAACEVELEQWTAVIVVPRPDPVLWSSLSLTFPHWDRSAAAAAAVAPHDTQVAQAWESL